MTMSAKDYMKAHLHDKIRWVETEPFVWRLHGAVMIHGIDLEKIQPIDYLVQAELCKEKCSFYAGFVYDKTKGIYWSDETDVRLEEIQIDLPPFLSVKCYFPFYAGILEPPKADYKEVNGVVIPTDEATSEVATRRLIQMLTRHYNLRTCTEDRLMQMSSPAKSSSSVRFLHCISSVGFGHVDYLEYRFDDLLNMDCTKFSETSLLYFKKECENNELLKKSLNMAVFKRMLTDEEKVESASLFLKKYQRLSERNITKKLKNFNYATC